MKQLAIVCGSILLIPPTLIFLLIVYVGHLFDKHHVQASEAARDVAKASRVAAGLATVWAWLVAPSGLTAVAGSAGIVSTPAIVLIAPWLIATAGGAYTVSAAIDLYRKWRGKRYIRR
jgi:hypothetical protein